MSTSSATLKLGPSNGAVLPSMASCAYDWVPLAPYKVTVCQSKVVLFSFQRSNGGVSPKGGFPLSPCSAVPRCWGYQILLPLAWRGPSQIRSIARAF